MMIEIVGRIAVLAAAIGACVFFGVPVWAFYWRLVRQFWGF